MGCSSCGKRRTMPGQTVTAPYVLGERADLPVHKVRVEQRGVIPTAGVGAIRYVVGTGVQPAVDEGQLTVLQTYEAAGYKTVQGVSGTLYCVGTGDNEVCYTDAEQAIAAAEQAGDEVVEKPAGVS